jgi:predicted nucleic acid-binding Zn ribbon protein
MPIYEYRRPDGTTFEIQQSFSEEPLKVDPDTGVRVERVLHPPAVHFKGKGFYSTDYGTRKRQRETIAAAEGSSAASSNGAGPEKSASAEASGSDGAGKSATKKSDGADKVSAKA